MKSIILCTILAIAAVTLVSAENYRWGAVGWNDTLAHRQIYVKSSSFLKVVTLDAAFPVNGTLNYRTITGIVITDQKSKGKGGYASLYGGGIGYTNAVIHLKSQRNQGINFIVEIYVR